MNSNSFGSWLATLSSLEQEWLYTYLGASPEELRMARASWLLARYQLPRSTRSLTFFLEAVERQHSQQGRPL